MLQTLDSVPRHPLEKGWHTPVTTPHIFIDGCVQIWPDADFANLYRHSVTAYMITTCRPHDDHGNALDAFAEWWRIARRFPTLRIALTADDIVVAKAAGQAAIVLGTQGADLIGQELARLEMFHRMGLRVMIPAYNARTPLADGLLEPGNAGLSRLGMQWVEECNRLGVLIDCTHVGERSTLDILARTRKPVAFTHSNPKALVDSPRNITDEQMRLCADTGGVIGVTNWGPLNYKGGPARPKMADWLDGVDYVIRHVGIDHVSMGTDMSHGTYPDGDRIRGRKMGGGYNDTIEGNPRSRLRHVEGFDDYGHLPDVVDAMLARGWGSSGVEKILGGNLLRVFRDVW